LQNRAGAVNDIVQGDLGLMASFPWLEDQALAERPLSSSNNFKADDEVLLRSYRDLEAMRYPCEKPHPIVSLALNQFNCRNLTG
jgi:hypothetical protein